jgi:hypothetical protein
MCWQVVHVDVHVHLHVHVDVHGRPPYDVENTLRIGSTLAGTLC